MHQETKRKQCFLLRLPLSVREDAIQIAQNEGTSLNHFISIAVAEKVSRMEKSPNRRSNDNSESPVRKPLSRPQ
jgi:hypothetical protein